MKILCMSALLFAPIASFGQTDLFQMSPIGDTAPVKTYRTDAGIGKGIRLAFSTLFYPARAKDEWPFYGYSIPKLKNELCSEQSLPHKKVTLKLAAFARLRQDRPDTDHDAYIGVPLWRPDEGAITTKIEDLCAGIEKPGLEDKLRMYHAVDLPKGTWERTSDVLPEEAIPLLSGTSMIGDVWEQYYSMIWTLSGRSGPDVPELKIAWRGYESGSFGQRRPLDTIWKYVIRGNYRLYGDYYLARVGSEDSPQDNNGESSWTGNGNSLQNYSDTIDIWSPWVGNFQVQGQLGLDVTSGSSYSIWHLPPGNPQQSVSQQFLDKWYIVTDDPLPNAETDVRLDPFK